MLDIVFPRKVIWSSSEVQHLFDFERRKMGMRNCHYSTEDWLQVETWPLVSPVSTSVVACGSLMCRKIGKAGTSGILALFLLLWESCCYSTLTQVDLESPWCLAELLLPPPLLPGGGEAKPWNFAEILQNSSAGSAGFTPFMARAISIWALDFLRFSFWEFFPFCVSTYVLFFFAFFFFLVTP